MPTRDRLKSLARRVARDARVDWAAEEAAASGDEELRRIRELRLLSAMSSFHRAAQLEGAGSDLETSVSLARSAADLDSLAPLPPPTARTLLAAGARWLHLEILGPAGSGAFGDVYRARDPRLDREVALKLLLPSVAGAPADDALREARLLAKVQHPHIATVYGADRADGRVGIWMEYLKGETLEQILRQRGRLDPREAALVGIDLCRALAAVHANGVIHQDVKLANVMRVEGGRIVLTDFGLGHEVQGEVRPGRGLSGTPLFMAPELLEGGRPSTASDLYSLGVVLFALVTGELPVQASSLRALRAKHAARDRKHARELRAELPAAFSDLLDRLLAPEPRDRFASAGAVERELLRVLGASSSTEPIPAQRGRTWLPAAVLGLATLVALFAAQRLLPIRAHAPVTATPFPIPDQPAVTLLGDKPSGMFGLAVTAAGDVDQDGYVDLLIGAPDRSSDTARRAGKVSLYRGAKEGVVAEVAWSLAGDVEEGRLGWAIAPANFTFGDGFADFAVGAPGSDDAGSVPGRVLLFTGSRTGPSAAPVQVFSSHLSGTRFGNAVATGDVNHDGVSDLLIGEPGYPDPDRRDGRALFYLGTNHGFADEPTQILSGPPLSNFGLALSLGGDLNGDGFADAVIGAPSASLGPDLHGCGAAFVYLGTATGLDSLCTLLPGRQAEASFGQDAIIAGDLDADGFADLVIGAEFASAGQEREGTAEIYYGSPAGVSPFGASLLEPNIAGANFGGHAADLEDLDGDGCADLFVGAVRYQRRDPREGAIFLYHGRRDRSLPPPEIRYGRKPGSWYGSAAGAGDLNADGRPDFFVSACAWESDLGMNVGKVEIYLNQRALGDRTFPVTAPPRGRSPP